MAWLASTHRYLIAVWVAGLFTWILMIFFALFVPQRPIEADIAVGGKVGPAPLEQLEVCCLYACGSLTAAPMLPARAFELRCHCNAC